MVSTGLQKVAAVVVALVAALVAAWGLHALTARVTLSYLNSDLLFLVDLHRDLVRGTSLRGWYLPSVMSVFPDAPLMLTLLQATANLGRAFFLYGVATLLLIGGAAYCLLEELRPAPRLSLLQATVACLALVLLVGAAPMPAPVFFWPSYHGGSILAGLWLWALALRAHRRGWSIGARLAFFVILTGSALSDQFIITQFLLPLLVAELWVWRRRRASRLTVVTTFDLVLASAFAVQLILYALVAVTSPAVTPNGALRAAMRLRAVFLWLAPVVAAVWLWSTRLRTPGGRDARDHDHARGMHLAALIHLCAIGTGLGGLLGWENVSTLRYVQPLYVLPPFVAVALLGRLRLRREGTIMAALVVILSGMVALQAGRGAASLEVTHPAGLDCVEAVVARRGLHAGYTDYWTARPFNLFLGDDKQLVPLRVDTLEVDTTIYNVAHVQGPDGRPRRFDYTLMVAERPPDLTVGTVMGLFESAVRSRFGAPSSIDRCDHLAVWAYDHPLEPPTL